MSYKNTKQIYICLFIYKRVQGSTTLDGPPRSWYELRNLGVDNASLLPEVREALEIIDSIDDDTPDEQLPRNLYDITPDWASIGVGPSPLSYRNPPSSDDAVAGSFYQLMLIMTNRRLLIAGEVEMSPMRMCARLLGCDYTRTSNMSNTFQNIGGRGNNVGTWPRTNQHGYQWNVDYVDENTKRKAMRVLFISLNEVIRHHYPGRTVDTLGDSTFQYG